MKRRENCNSYLGVLIVAGVVAFVPLRVTASSGLYVEPKTFSVGNGATSVAVGDFNGDGKKDLAVANQTDNTVSVLLGNGDGTFLPATNYHATSPTYLTTGDFNNDGHPDLVSVVSGHNIVEILLGNGSGGFGAPSQILIQGVTQCTSAVVGDFNKDGNLDIAVACGQYTPAGIAILLGNGNGTFQPPTVITAGDPYLRDTYLAAADLNGDGNLDLVGANYRGAGVDVLLGNGNGTFQPGRSFPPACRLELTGWPLETLTVTGN